MSAVSVMVRTLMAVGMVGLVVASPARAHDSGGGTAAPGKPKVEKLSCPSAASAACSAGEPLRVEGEALEDTRTVVFLGRSGTRDDRRVRPSTQGEHELVVTVPSSARTGRVRVVSRHSGPSRPGPRVVVNRKVTSSIPVSGDAVFPIRGKYEFGKAKANRFGGGRGHQGYDVFASCGTPLVAAQSGTVDRAGFESRAGNHVVITDAAGQSSVYMHMRKKPLVGKGQAVTAGQPIGVVGQTGRADGCHLHFERWTAPGWYQGGDPFDPLPELKAWARLG